MTVQPQMKAGEERKFRREHARGNLWPIISSIQPFFSLAGLEKWLRSFGQLDKWIVCLTAGTVVPANQEKS